jgi:hypothetical protein
MGKLRFFQKQSVSIKIVRRELDRLLSNKGFVVLLRSNLLLLGLQWLGVGVFYTFLPPQVPLFYSRPWGQDQLADKQFLFIVPAVASVLFLVHTLVNGKYVKVNKLMVHIFLWGQLAVNILATVVVIKTILLVS